MTIKEIEVMTGMTRANIRFYESQGLMTPARGANGYRDYSEEDVAQLQRIRLLRNLRLSLEEIRKLQTGQEELSTALSRQIRVLEQERTETDRAQRVCREIREDGVSFRTLDAQPYLYALGRSRREPDRVQQEDRPARVQVPFRRYFARFLDVFFYEVLTACFLMVVCNIRVVEHGILMAVLPILLTIVLEPLWLSLTGTTPGKWIFGLSVTTLSGDRLDYWEAINRTCSVLWKGTGLGIPIYSLVRLWKMYTLASENEALPWEEDSQVLLKDRKPWRFAAGAAAAALLVGLLAAGTAAAESPRHRGDLTAETYCENFNRLARYYRMDKGKELRPDGHWADPSVTDPEGAPDIYLEETDGRLTAVSFTYATTESYGWLNAFQRQFPIAAVAFAGARDGFGFFSDARAALVDTIQRHPNSGYRFSEQGVTVECEVEAEGYQQSPDGYLLRPLEGAQTYYSVSFRMTLEG